MTPPEPWPEILAAYADGELTPADRAAVDRYLLAHPDARAMVRAQKQFSPANQRLWDACEPPTPRPADWVAVRAAVAAEVLPVPAGRRWVMPAVAAAAVAMAAGAAIWFVAGPRGGPNTPPAVVRAPAEVPPAVTGPDDHNQLAEVGAESDAEPFTLAAAGDVELAGVSAQTWPGGPPPMGGPADAPMIYAAGQR